MTKIDPSAVEAALIKATTHEPDLNDQERAALRAMLEWWHMWQAWGRLGKIILWLIVSAGAAAAAIRELGLWAR